MPELMLCKPTTNDRWDRRAIELAAYLHAHGHCNVPEEYEPNPELGMWVKRQRVARAASQLNEERLQVRAGHGRRCVAWRARARAHLPSSAADPDVHGL